MPIKVNIQTYLGSVAAFLKAPFRGTFKGVIHDAQTLEATQTGLAKRTFKLMDTVGDFIICCALEKNAQKHMITPGAEVVLYFATGRGPIGSSSGMLYLMKDSMLMCIGLTANLCELRAEMPITGDSKKTS